MSGITAVGFYIVSLFFSLLIYSLWLRIALRYFRVSSLNQLSQLIYKVTNPLLNPVQWLFRQKYQHGQKYDKMAFGVLLVVELLKIIIMSLLVFHTIIPLGFLLIYVLADLIIQHCDLLFYIILFRVIMSFANPAWKSPIADFLRLITDPLLIVGRKIVPDISGFDFSPFIIMFLLKIITLFINANLPWRLL